MFPAALLTVRVHEHGQELPVERAHVEEQGWTLERPEAQGHVLSSERDVRMDRGRRDAAVPRDLRTILDGVAHRRS